MRIRKVRGSKSHYYLCCTLNYHLYHLYSIHLTNVYLTALYNILYHVRNERGMKRQANRRDRPNADPADVPRLQIIPKQTTKLNK